MPRPGAHLGPNAGSSFYSLCLASLFPSWSLWHNGTLLPATTCNSLNADERRLEASSWPQRALLGRASFLRRLGGGGVLQVVIRPPAVSACTLAVALGQSLWSNPVGQGSVRQGRPCAARVPSGSDSDIHVSCCETSLRGMNPPPPPTPQGKLTWPCHR